MNEPKHDAVWQERRLEEILFSRSDPVTKVRQIMHLGFAEEVATEIVERYEVGQVPAYYESLDLDFENDYYGDLPR